MRFSRIDAFVLNPFVVFGSVLLGIAFGTFFPALGLRLGIVGQVYISLLTMVTLPFMLSAVIFSVQRLFQDGSTHGLVKRLGVVFALFLLALSITSTVLALVIEPGAGLSEQTRQAFGKIVGSDTTATFSDLLLVPEAEPESAGGTASLLMSLIPSNIFAALSAGDTVKALVFALFFGFALGQIPAAMSNGFTQSLESVYRTCQTLMRWFTLPIPIVLFCLGAEQIAKSGFEPFKVMGPFVLSFLLLSVVIVLASGLIIWQRSGQRLGRVLLALREPFVLALATRSSFACMPSMIEALSTKLRFNLIAVELLVPTSILLLRTGALAYYVMATFFIAQLYGRELTGPEVLLAVGVCVLASVASAGMSGIVSLSMIAMSCGALGLPVEAALILFVAVEPVCDALRTIAFVICNLAAVSLICPDPSRGRPHPDPAEHAAAR